MIQIVLFYYLSQTETKLQGSQDERDAIHQRVESLKIRRSAERTKMILTAAANGNLGAMTQALKVIILIDLLNPKSFNPKK